MKRTLWILLVSMVIIAAFPCKALAVSTEEVTNKILASDGTINDVFGSSVASSGYKVVIGAPYDNVFGAYSGSAYVYDLSSGSLADILASEIKLTPSDGAYNDRYGYAVTISGDIVVIGAYYDDDSASESGSVYIYDLSHGTGSAADVRASQIKLTPSDGVTNGFFGETVSISGNTLIVGAHGDDDRGTYSGSVYLYNLSNANISATQKKISASDGESVDCFGCSVDLSGNMLVVGAYGDDDRGSGAGAAYVYNLANGSGSAADIMASERKLTASDGALGDYFGMKVAISGNNVVIGAYMDKDFGNMSGSAYVYNLANGSGSAADVRASQRKLTAYDGAEFDSYGNGVAVSGDIAVISANADDDKGGNSGAAYVYDLSAANVLDSVIKLTASDGASSDNFGCAVDFLGDKMIIGAMGDSDNGFNSGSAYFQSAKELMGTTISYNDNGGTGGQSTTLSATYESDMPTPITLPTRAGYVFNGYYDASSGGTQYYTSYGASARNWDKEDATATLYAQWTAKQTTISYSDNGGSGGQSAVTTAIYDSAMPTPITLPTRTGYNFAGYYDASRGGTQYYTSSGVSAKTWDKEDAVFTLYAQWTAKETTISYSDNGGSGGQSATKTAVYDSDMPTPITLPTRTGYVFNGYYDASSDGTQYYTSYGASARNWDKEDATATLYAQWTAKQTTISYSDNGGSGGQSAVTTAIYDSAMPTPITLPTRTGYNFAGYYDASSGGTQYYTSSGVSAKTWDKEDAVFTLYAQWTAKETTISYSDNGGSGGQSATKTAAYDSDMPTPITLPTRIGYAFNGYYDAQSGGTQYYTSTGASAGPWNKEDIAVTFYAQWTQLIYTITYDNNGGVGTEASVTGVYDETVVLSDGAAFSKAGYVLDKWDIGKLSGLYTFSGNVSANAVWLTDSDGDGASDVDEDNAGSDKNDPDDTPQEGTIKVTALNNDGSAASGTFVLNSTPQTLTTDSDGSVVFTGVSLVSHTLSYRVGTTQCGSYSLVFSNGSPNSTTIQDDASTDSIGTVTTIYNSRFLTLELTIQLNSANEWQIIEIGYIRRAIVDNPETGEY